MLRINQQSNAAAAKSYHGSVAEYHRPDGEQEIVGQWYGQTADRLDLAGDVLRLHFERLCDNRHPFTGDQLTARMRKDRRVGYDFTFDAPKSVSILYGITDDSAILDAFRQAVSATMKEMEEGVKTRVRKRGQYGERTVGNMAWAEFLHFTARPVKGEIDPHLHAHCFVPNVCWDHAEHAWKAIDVASVKEDAPHWQAAFQRRFGQRLAELGYAVAWSGDHFEIAGIGRATIDRFSRRTHLINQTAEKRGITDPGDKAQLGAMTRERKRKDATMPGLRARWRERLTDDERSAIALAGWKRRWHAGTPYPQARAQPERDTWEKERLDFIRLRQRRLDTHRKPVGSVPVPPRAGYER